MRTAFVLSGGASHGAIQVGMLKALAAHGIFPDIVAGTSAGAMNAAWVAGDPTLADLDELAAIWGNMRRRSVFQISPASGLMSALGRRPALAENHGIAAILKEHLRFTSFEDTAIALRVVATDLATGEPRVFADGNPIDAILASAAIPSVLPPVTIDERLYVDGGLTRHLPLDAIDLASCDRIYVLPAGHAPAELSAPESLLDMGLHTVAIMLNAQMNAQLDNVVRQFGTSLDVRVLPSLNPVGVAAFDFSQSAALIERAFDAANNCIANHEWTKAREQLRFRIE